MDTAALSLLKANLGFFGSEIPEDLETYLDSRITVAKDQLREHCRISLSEADPRYDAWFGIYTDLVAMYAAWLYTRSKTGESKPPMLTAAIRNWQMNFPKEETA